MNSKLFTLLFWKDTAERVISVFLATLVTTLGVYTGVLNSDWRNAVITAASAALAMLVKCVASVLRPGTISPASLVKEEPSNANAL